MSKKKPDIQNIADFLDYESEDNHRELKRLLDLRERRFFEHCSSVVEKNLIWDDKEIEVLVSLKKKELDKSVSEPSYRKTERKIHLLLNAYKAELDSKPSTVEQAQTLAFNERINYYYANFIDHNAKHIGTKLELDICDFFRRVKGNIVTSDGRQIDKLPILQSAREKYQLVIKKLDFHEEQTFVTACSASSAYHGSRWVAQSIDPKRLFIQTEAAEETRFGYCATLFRSIQAVTLRQYLEQCISDGTQIDVVDQSRMPRRISITRDFIDNVPRVARCMTVARNLEKIAFTSLYVSDTTQDAVRAAHDAEQEKSEEIDVMKWEATPDSIEQIILQIKKLIHDKQFKKYLKYKNKYLSLKKQITL